MSGLAIKMPGRVLREFVEMADARVDADADQDLCEAVSRARVTRRGTGFTALVPIADTEQARRLVAWVPDDAPRFLREYRDMVNRDG